MRSNRAETWSRAAGRRVRPRIDEAVREVGELRLVPEALAGSGESFGRTRDFKMGTQPTPQLRLPASVVGQTSVVPRGPPRQHLRPMQRVAIEEPCDVLHRAEPPPGALEVCVEGAKPGLVTVLVDHLQQRPHRATGPPRVFVGIDTRRGSQRALDNTAGRRERHVGADPVPTTGRRAEFEATAAVLSTARRPWTARRRSRPRTDRRAGWQASRGGHRRGRPCGWLGGRRAFLGRKPARLSDAGADGASEDGRSSETTLI